MSNEIKSGVEKPVKKVTKKPIGKETKKLVEKETKEIVVKSNKQIEKEFELPPSKIVASNISMRYGKKLALDDVSYEFHEGDVTGLIGFNGSGKTTTFNILTNFITNYDGTVEYNDRLPVMEDFHGISYLSAGEEQANNESWYSHLKFFCHTYRMRRREMKPKIIALAREFYLKEKLSTKIKSLSKGNQQKIKIISAFLNPRLKYLFLDEPFDGLDPMMIERIKKIILKKTTDEKLVTIITSHRMDVINDMCSSYFILKDGKLIDSFEKSDVVESVVLQVNIEADVEKLKKLDEVLEIYDSGSSHFITIDSKKSIRIVTKHLIEVENYEQHSVVKKTIAERVFERYDHDTKE